MTRTSYFAYFSLAALAAAGLALAQDTQNATPSPDQNQPALTATQQHAESWMASCRRSGSGRRHGSRSAGRFIRAGSGPEPSSKPGAASAAELFAAGILSGTAGAAQLQCVSSAELSGCPAKLSGSPSQLSGRSPELSGRSPELSGAPPNYQGSQQTPPPLHRPRFRPA